MIPCYIIQTFFNINTLLYNQPGAGQYWIHLHEFAHFLGLNHPHDADGSQGIHGVFAPDHLGTYKTKQGVYLNTSYHSDFYTIESYKDWQELNSEDVPLMRLTEETGWPMSPMPLSVFLLGAMHGLAENINPEDNTYVLTKEPDAACIGHEYIVDTGGIDEIRYVSTNNFEYAPFHIDTRPAIVRSGQDSENGYAHTGGGWSFVKDIPITLLVWENSEIEKVSVHATTARDGDGSHIIGSDISNTFTIQDTIVTLTTGGGTDGIYNLENSFLTITDFDPDHDWAHFRNSELTDPEIPYDVFYAESIQELKIQLNGDFHTTYIFNNVAPEDAERIKSRIVFADFEGVEYVPPTCG
jgi:hypothetical protein